MSLFSSCPPITSSSTPLTLSTPPSSHVFQPSQSRPSDNVEFIESVLKRKLIITTSAQGTALNSTSSTGAIHDTPGPLKFCICGSHVNNLSRMIFLADMLRSWDLQTVEVGMVLVLSASTPALLEKTVKQIVDTPFHTKLHLIQSAGSQFQKFAIAMKYLFSAKLVTDDDWIFFTDDDDMWHPERTMVFQNMCQHLQPNRSCQVGIITSRARANSTRYTSKQSNENLVYFYQADDKYHHTYQIPEAQATKHLRFQTDFSTYSLTVWMCCMRAHELDKWLSSVPDWLLQHRYCDQAFIHDVCTSINPFYTALFSPELHVRGEFGKTLLNWMYFTRTSRQCGQVLNVFQHCTLIEWSLKVVMPFINYIQEYNPVQEVTWCLSLLPNSAELVTNPSLMILVAQEWLALVSVSLVMYMLDTVEYWVLSDHRFKLDDYDWKDWLNHYSARAEVALDTLFYLPTVEKDWNDMLDDTKCSEFRKQAIRITLQSLKFFQTGEASKYVISLCNVVQKRALTPLAKVLQYGLNEVRKKFRSQPYVNVTQSFSFMAEGEGKNNRASDLRFYLSNQNLWCESYELTKEIKDMIAEEIQEAEEAKHRPVHAVRCECENCGHHYRRTVRV